MIPVMIWGFFINQRRYDAADIGVAALITVGCTIFGLYGDVTNKHASTGAETSWYGGALMLGYLGFDGFTSTFQDKLFKGYHMETYNQMVWVNLCSATISLFWLLSDNSISQALSLLDDIPPSWATSLFSPQQLCWDNSVSCTPFASLVLYFSPPS